jgi:hypothetical protein
MSVHVTEKQTTKGIRFTQMGKTKAVRQAAGQHEKQMRPDILSGRQMKINEL